MSKWNKISLYKFQQIELINAKKDLDDIGKTLFSTCVVFDMTEYQLDNAPIRKVNRLVSEMQKIFSTELKPVPKKRIGKYFLNYDMGAIRFGQYRELSFYLSSNYIQNAHKILASVSNTWKRKNDSETHEKRAGYFLNKSIDKITGCLSLIVERFSAFNKEYNWLFGLDTETHESEAISNPFNKKYGWVYASEQIATLKKITLDEVDDLNIREVFNHLAYLKAKSKYEAEQIKNNGR